MDATLRNIFGLNVSRLRIEAGISKKRFALMAGISRPYLNAIEDGTANVTLDVIERVAAGLNVPPSDLFAVAVRTS